LAFHGAIGEILTLSWIDERYTHIIFIPFLSLGLMLMERNRISTTMQYRPRAGAPLVGLGAATYVFARAWPQYLGQDGSLALAAGAIVLAWIGLFVVFFGFRSASAVLFPLSLLAFIIPIPPLWIEQVEVFLQRGSAEAAHIIFKATGTPVFREDLVFSLPGLSVEVAKECSGIRSSISLLITALLLSYLFLRSPWRRSLLVLATLPIAIIRNALRITTLSWLGAFVSQDYLHGNLHHRGGPIFALISLALLLPMLWLLRHGERARRSPASACLASPAPADR
jgi:exosortase